MMTLVEVADLTISQMRKHGLHEPWGFEFLDRKCAVGSCCYRTKRIGISKHWATVLPREQILDTILHEIAHALVGSGWGHGPVWRRMCVQIGANPERLLKGFAHLAPKGKWELFCPFCGWKCYKHKRLQNGRRRACPECCTKHSGGRFDSQYALVWRQLY